MRRKQHGLITWLEFEIFQPYPNLKHGVFLKHGGSSLGSFATLNVGVGIGDNDDLVEKNRQHIYRTLNLSTIHSPDQVHGDHVLIIDKNSTAKGVAADGLITSLVDNALMIKHADCQAAIFFDPIKQVVACIHAGWRGSCLNIYQKTVDLLVKRFGSNPSSILVGISPSLGPDKSEFIHYRRELPESFWEYQVRENYFDFWRISQDQLLEAGLKEKNIEIAKICTFENPEDYFSYRRDKPTGRHATIVALSS